MATYVDVGANLTDGMFRGVYRGKRAHEDDLRAVLRRARDAGVSDVIVTAGTLEEAREAVALARETREEGAAPRLHATCGVHPTRCGAFADDVDGADAHLEKLKRVALDGKASGTIVAIGEMGLDYDRLEFCDAATQKEMFEKQFALAEATSLPLFLHMRAACDDFLEIIDRNAHRFTAGVVHSFTGGAREAAAVLARDQSPHRSQRLLAQDPRKPRRGEDDSTRSNRPRNRRPVVRDQARARRFRRRRAAALVAEARQEGQVVPGRSDQGPLRAGAHRVRRSDHRLRARRRRGRRRRGVRVATRAASSSPRASINLITRPSVRSVYI